MRNRTAFWAALMVFAPLLGGCAEEGSVDVGDDMPELTWEGYVNENAVGVSTEQPFSDYGTAQLAATGRRYAVLHTSADF